MERLRTGELGGGQVEADSSTLVHWFPFTSPALHPPDAQHAQGSTIELKADCRGPNA
jgi:hypothetical protein